MSIEQEKKIDSFKSILDPIITEYFKELEGLGDIKPDEKKIVSDIFETVKGIGSLKDAKMFLAGMVFAEQFSNEQIMTLGKIVEWKLEQ